MEIIKNSKGGEKLCFKGNAETIKSIGVNSGELGSRDPPPDFEVEGRGVSAAIPSRRAVASIIVVASVVSII